MNSLNLNDSVARYKADSVVKKQKRDLWNTSIKDLLIGTLNKICTEYPIGWQMELIGSSTNLEGVTLTFGDSIIGVEPSISEPAVADENSKEVEVEMELKYYTKHEGTLAFSQAYNGDVFVIIVFPTIEEIVNHKDSQKLELRVHPSKITTQFIEQQVANFLDEIVKWESSTMYNDIGFVVKR